MIILQYNFCNCLEELLSIIIIILMTCTIIRTYANVQYMHTNISFKLSIMCCQILLLVFSKKQIMIADNGEDQLNEIQMFHGTMPQNIRVICQEGFDHRVASMGGAIGAGTHCNIVDTQI